MDINKNDFSLDDKIAEQRFWDVIEKSNVKGNTNWEEYDMEEHIEALTEELSLWSKKDLIDFEIQMCKNLRELYKANIMELSIILDGDFKKKGDKIKFDGYISTDGFLYFRCWLLLAGKTFFDEIKEDINAFVNGKYSFDIGDIWGESLLSVSDTAYSENNDNEDEAEIRDAVDELFPEIDYDMGEMVLDREPESGYILQEKYPKLVAEIIEIR